MNQLFVTPSFLWQPVHDGDFISSKSMGRVLGNQHLAIPKQMQRLFVEFLVLWYVQRVVR